LGADAFFPTTRARAREQPSAIIIIIIDIISVDEGAKKEKKKGRWNVWYYYSCRV